MVTTGSAHSRERDFQRGQAESAGRKQSRNPKTANYKVAVITKAKGGVSLEEHNTPEFLFQGPLDQALAHVERREEEEREEGGSE